MESDSLEAGQLFDRGRFVLVRHLGHGGMGEVWLAHDERLHEDVALKFLPREIRRDAKALDDLRRETARSHKLTHPNIVRIHDLHEEEGGMAFIVMEYVDGPTLEAVSLQQANRVLTWQQLRPWVEQLCLALDYAHGEKVIHRDLKPTNMMVDSRGRLKLADFGIAAVASDSMSRVSVKHSTSGTLPYMSPQQLAGKRPQASDDIYALGATLYELLTSQPPFYTGDLTYQILNEMPEPPGERLAALEIQNPIPSDVAALVMACLAKEPGQRPASACAVAEWIGLEVEKKPSGQALSEAMFGKEEESPAEEAQMDERKSSMSVLTRPLKFVTGVFTLLAQILLLVLLIASFWAFLSWRAETKRQEQLQDQKEQNEAEIQQRQLQPPRPSPTRPALISTAIAAQNNSATTAAMVLPENLKQNLVLWYAFDAPESGGRITDESGHGNDGQATGTQWTSSGKFGGALVFSPTDSHIRVPNNESLNPEQFTICAWVKTTLKDQFWRRIFDKGLFHKGFDLTLAGDYVKWNPPTKCRGFVAFELPGQYMQSIHSIADGQWHHVAATYDGEDMRLFVDGEPQSIKHCPGDFSGNNLDLMIGGFIDSGKNDDPHASFDGSLDEVMMFNRSLSPAEVWQLYDLQGASSQ